MSPQFREATVVVEDRARVDDAARPDTGIGADDGIRTDDDVAFDDGARAFYDALGYVPLAVRTTKELEGGVVLDAGNNLSQPRPS